MYNGIGLATARGSGTNGHVQRNLSFVRQGKKDNVKYKTEAELAKAEAINNRGPNEEILEHERKRKIEIKCMEFQEILEDGDNTYTDEEIATKVQSYREKLLGESKNEQLPKDEFGRYAVRDTHQIAAAKHEKNAMLRSAFGISEYFVEGSSFDADRKAKEEIAKSAALQKELEAQQQDDAQKTKQYKLVRTPSREREIEKNNGKSTDETKEKEDKSKRKKDDKSRDKKKKKKTDTSDESSSSSDEESSRKRSHRRKRRESSTSDSESDSSDSDSEPSKKKKRRDRSADRKKRSSHSKKSKKHRRHSTSSSSSDSYSSSSSSSSSSSYSSSSSSSSSSSDSDSHHKRKHRRK